MGSAVGLVIFSNFDLTMTQVYLNGQILNQQQATISVMDRGFLFGDGVYEVIPVYASQLFRFSQHITRLNRSLAQIEMSPVHSEATWLSLCNQIIKANQLNNGSLYIQVTRGAYTERDHRYPNPYEPTVFITANKAKDSVEALTPKVGKLVSIQDLRWQRCDIKAITLLPNCMARSAADKVGADEALLIRDGYALEGSASNVFMVKNKVLFTAPLSANILAGITRDLVVEIALKNHIKVVEESQLLDDMLNADEVWLTSSSREIQPITQIDGRTIGDGKVGALWHQMADLYLAFKKQLYSGLAQ